MEHTRTLRADLVDPATLAALGHLEIVARWIVDGFLSGLHRSPRKGFSVEFADFRPYQPGDDLRYVDWKIAARADRWVVKQYEEETNLRCTLVLDVSRSMDWRGASPELRLTKRAYAEQLVAALALLLLRQRDAVGLIRFDDAIRTSIPPRARTTQWRRVAGALSEPATGGRASDLATALAGTARLVTRRGMVVRVSDLLVDVEAALPALRGLRAAGHDVTVFHVMDPAERRFAHVGEAQFTDPETELAVPASADVRAAYDATVAEVIEEWRAALGAMGVGYELLLTDQPYALALRRAFDARLRHP